MAESTALTPAWPDGSDGLSLNNRGGKLGSRLQGLAAQPAIRRALPALAGLGLLAGAGVLYLALASEPQRVLYTTLSDGERAAVVSSLETAGIAFEIDPATGMLSVPEDELYRARMVVAADGGLVSPDNSIELLDSIPLGSSRTLEGERLRNVREQELVRTIEEIDSVETARVHLASPERSVFVRENVAPSASVMLRLARGRSLSPDQVAAIVNLVAGSVPGLSVADVRVADQHGRLLSQTGSEADSQLELQRAFEDKLQLQVSQLLTPLVGAENFSSQVQVELDMAEVTSARESYDDSGVVRSESQSSSSQGGETLAGGIPGATSNTPPPNATLEQGAPQGGQPNGCTNPQSGQESAQRVYEVGREVAVSSTRPGGVRRITVAVVLSAKAVQAIKPATADQVRELVESAVGASLERGDKVTVIAGAFDPVKEEETPFYQTGWFDMAIRYGSGLLAVLLALLLGVRPILKALRRDPGAEEDAEDGTADAIAEAGEQAADGAKPISAQQTDLGEQVDLARRLAAEQPERAVVALKRMLADPGEGRAA